MITDNYYPKIGGVEYCVDALARHLVQKGHEVTIITRKRRHLPSFEHKGLLRIRRVSYVNMFGLLLGASLRKCFFFDKCDIIHAHSLGSPLAIFALLIAKFIKKPHVLTSHSLYRDFDKWPMKCLGKLVPHAICVSKAVVADMQSVNKNVITHLIPNGFDVIQANQVDDCFSLGKNTGEIVIATVSRLTRKKDVSSFITIADCLVKHFHFLKFIIIGDGPQRKKLQKKMNTLGLTEKIHFTGTLPRPLVLSVLKQTDIFVLTSPHEAFGMVILEAISQNIPTVAFDNNGISDFITSGKTGYLAASLEEMVNCVIKLIENTEHRSQLAKNAAPIINHYQWDKVAEKTESVYHNVMLDLFREKPSVVLK